VIHFIIVVSILALFFILARCVNSVRYQALVVVTASGIDSGSDVSFIALSPTDYDNQSYSYLDLYIVVMISSI